jgi:peptidoglycan/LPS O-acetylase OafA/YrhL
MKAGTTKGYMPALDGMRGVCIIAVILHHADVPYALGGFLGVDGFFTLSGFLITSLLLQEYRTTGAIDFRAFYLRRALRLLPALFLLLGAVSIGVLLLQPSQQSASANARGVAASLFYVANWVKISVGTPELVNLGVLGHTWSLAIEEQFYLLWPLLLIFLLRRSPKRLVYWLVVFILLSIAVRASLILAGTPPGAYRVYDGSDTRADSLLIGCLLATLLSSGQVDWSSKLAVQFSRVAVCVAIPILVYLWVFGDYYDPFFYMGGFTLDAISVAFLIMHVRVVPNGIVARVLSYRWLVGVGIVSYGLYLWHWPIFQVLPAQE